MLLWLVCSRGQVCSFTTVANASGLSFLRPLFADLSSARETQRQKYPECHDALRLHLRTGNRLALITTIQVCLRLSRVARQVDFLCAVLRNLYLPVHRYQWILLEFRLQ